MADEEEYESDPEQAKLSLKMRRRTVASDDEDDDDDKDDIRVRDVDSRVSDYESDGQGAAAEYYDDDENDDDGYDDDDDLVEEDDVIEEVEVVEGVIGEDCVGVKKENDDDDDNVNGGLGEGEAGQGEKKENEPSAVPTAGAFYMHDDRFRDSSGGRHRRSLGRGKLWELRDDRKWGHDKFEELTMHERHYDEGRRVSRGRNRARGGRSRGEDCGFVRGNRPKTFNNSSQNNAPKSVRGRGPRRYQSSSQNSFEAPAQSRQSTKSTDKTPHVSSGRASAATSSSDSSQVPVKKNLVASNLNSASPPFYPSGSSNKETNTTQKKDVQTGPLNRGPRPVMVENYPISQSNKVRGRNVSDSLGMNKLHIDDSVSRSEGRGPMNFGHVAYQPVAPHHNQVNRVTNLHHPSQQFVARSATGSRASSPPKTPGPPVHANESTEMESSTESNDSKTVLVGKGKGSITSSGMSPFSYGSLGGNHGDQNFSGAPTFLPVMQFAGQHPGGLGVPAVGMAFPGYVGQPNGMGSSEMTWLPVLAGAAGALGAAGLGGTYPYITMDGTYHAHPSAQPSSLPSLTSKENNTNKLGSEVKPSQRPELVNDDLRQRQNKARRYTEMTFDK
ncbi:protein MLN51 homolog [Rutidosis leptorrhynchoides]|uniref:protein MLN51 homolog n=1 Tax=Rutidosis leptorrhynchoides TaxID=125765 RepID=UPI003A990676